MWQEVNVSLETGKDRKNYNWFLTISGNQQFLAQAQINFKSNGVVLPVRRLNDVANNIFKKNVISIPQIRPLKTDKI